MSDSSGTTDSSYGDSMDGLRGGRWVSESQTSATTDASYYEDSMNGRQGGRWVSESQTPATTDASYYENSMINLREKTQSLSLESHVSVLLLLSSKRH